MATSVHLFGAVVAPPEERTHQSPTAASASGLPEEKREAVGGELSLLEHIQTWATQVARPAGESLEPTCKVAKLEATSPAAAGSNNNGDFDSLPMAMAAGVKGSEASDDADKSSDSASCTSANDADADGRASRNSNIECVVCGDKSSGKRTILLLLILILIEC